MASKKQIAANRRNAKKSTGPKTPEGKARSSQNAISHGLCSREVLLKEEDPDRFREVWQGVFEDLRPEGEVETYLACRVASGIWRMNRVLRIEAQLFNGSPIRAVQPEVTLGEIFKSAGQNGGNPFGKLMRHESAIDRGIQRALKELRALQAARAAHEEQVADGVTRELQRRAVEEALLNRGGAINGRAPAPGNGVLRNEPNRPASQAQQRPSGEQAAPGANGGARTEGAAQGKGAGGDNGSGAAGIATGNGKMQNEPNLAREPAARPFFREAGRGSVTAPGNGTADPAPHGAREPAARRRPLPS